MTFVNCMLPWTITGGEDKRCYCLSVLMVPRVLSLQYSWDSPLVTDCSWSMHLRRKSIDYFFRQALQEVDVCIETHSGSSHQLCPTVASAQLWRQRAHIPPPAGGWMPPRPFEAWLKETGFVRPIDFKFAFCSAQELAEACPSAAEAAAEAWLSVTEAETRLPSTWALWKQCRPGAKDRPAITVAAT